MGGAIEQGGAQQQPQHQQETSQDTDHEGGMTRGATSDLSSDFDVPSSIRMDFKALLEAGVSYRMFCGMTVWERQRVFNSLKVSGEDRLFIERAVNSDGNKLSYRRADSKNAINKLVREMNLDPEAPAFGVADSISFSSHSYHSKARGGHRKTNSSSVGTISYVDPHAPTTREAHRYSGLVNQSSTCYLNALLQSLFHLPTFRKAIYSLDVPAGVNPSESIPLALQELFLSLERKDRTRTVNLTQAFGWDTREAAIQHDIHELVRKLFDVLEQQFNQQPQQQAAEAGASSTAANEDSHSNPIKRLFAGVRHYYTQCLDAPYTSKRSEDFYDVELVVKENANIHASLTAETTPERLQGSNKYCWEHDDEPNDPATGKVRKTYHEADRGVAYAELPPVLMVHPNRLDFCMRTFQRVTVDSRWEFEADLDMSPYVESAPFASANHVIQKQKQQQQQQADDEDGEKQLPRQDTQPPQAPAPALATTGDQQQEQQQQPQQPPAEMVVTGTDGTGASKQHRYRLRSVVIHSGAATFGHYYCYVNFHNGAWVKFNDESVTDTTEAAMRKEAFGGSTVNQYGYTQHSSTRAALLIYVRETDVDEILKDVTEDDVPLRLRSMVEAEKAKAEQERLRLEREREMSSIPVVVCAADGSHLATLRDLKKAPIAKCDPGMTFEQADPQFRHATLWKINMYHAHSHHYRTSTTAAVPIPPTDVISRHFYKPTTSYVAPPTHVLIVVPHNVSPPPLTTPKLITACTRSATGESVYAGTYTSLEYLETAHADELAVRDASAPPPQAATAAAAATATTSAATFGPQQPQPPQDGSPADAYLPAGASPPLESAPHNIASDPDDRSSMGGAVGSSRDELGDDDVARAVQEVSEFSPLPDGESPTSALGGNAVNSMESASQALPATHAAGGSNGANGNFPMNGGCETPPTVSTGVTSKDQQQQQQRRRGAHVLVEAGLKLESMSIDKLVSGDIVHLVPADSTEAAVIRAFNEAHYAVDVGLYQLPSSFADRGADEYDNSISPTAMTPVVSPGDDSGSPAGRFPSAGEAVEMGQIRAVESDTFDDLQVIVARYLGDPSIDPRCIAFRSHSATADAPHKTLAQRAFPSYYGDKTVRLRTLKDILSGSGQYMICKLYYELLPMPVEEFEREGLKDYIAFDQGRKRHFWAAKCSSNYVYSNDAAKLRLDASRKLNIPIGRIALIGQDYYGAFDGIFANPREANPTPGDSPAIAAAAASAGADPDRSATLDDSTNQPPTAVVTPVQPGAPMSPPSDIPGGDSVMSNPRHNNDDDDEEATASVPNPLLAMDAAAAANNNNNSSSSNQQQQQQRSDIVVAYHAPSYLNMDQSHFVILPELPPVTMGVLPPKPHNPDEIPAVGSSTATLRDDSDSAAIAPAPSVMRWFLVGVQQSTKRSRDDIFGFAMATFVCENDTGAEALRRVIDAVGADPAQAEREKWHLCFMKTHASSPMLVKPDARIVDLLPFDHKPVTSSYSTYPYTYNDKFTGSFVLERTFPIGAKPPKERRSAQAEPELRIHGTSHATSTQDLTAVGNNNNNNGASNTTTAPL